jgi:hypothetical protein
MKVLQKRNSMFLVAITLSLPLLTGCNMNDPMIKELEVAQATAMRKKGETHLDRDAAVTLVVQKYFPPGMKAEDAFNHLRQLKSKGFEIGEYRHEGARNWPDGEFKPYLDEATRRNLQRQYPIGRSHFTAKKQYDTQMLIVTKHVAISFEVVDGSGVISSIEGSLWASGI